MPKGGDALLCEDNRRSGVRHILGDISIYKLKTRGWETSTFILTFTTWLHHKGIHHSVDIARGMRLTTWYRRYVTAVLKSWPHVRHNYVTGSYEPLRARTRVRVSRARTLVSIRTFIVVRVSTKLVFWYECLRARTLVQVSASSYNRTSLYEFVL